MTVRDTESVFPSPFVADEALAALPPATLLDDRYAIGGHVGRGGSCDVYRATDRLLGKEVAIKILRLDRVNTQSLARLRREVALAQQIQSHQVVRIHDLGVSGDTTFIAMELVEGETLSHRLARGTMPIDDAVQIAAEVLRGLDAIHALGIVHRDIKPSNILIDRKNRIKIGDLGLARQFDSDEQKLTRTEALVGTLPYLAPEQALGIRPDARTDLYSLGATLYECLTGVLPFERGSAVGTIASHITENAPPLRTIRSDVPRWLDRFVCRLLEKEPRNRFRSAAEALTSLQKRRVPIRWKRALSPLGLVAALVAIAGGVWWSVRPGELASFVPTGSGIRAVDSRGRTLWSIDSALPERAWVLNRGSDRAAVAVLRGMSGNLPHADRTRLLLLEPATGRELSHVVLPSADAVFGDFDDLFGVGVDVVDSNGDGADELVLRFSHTYWPWYAVHFDSATAVAQLLYVATGHQSTTAIADIDGDGRSEILFAGRDNRMGWYASLAAVPLRAGETPSWVDRSVAPCSPMVDRGSICVEGRGGWHTLLPRGWSRSVEIDAQSRTIDVIHASGERSVVRFDGVRVGVPADPATAIPNRTAAHKLLRSAEHREVAGLYRAALGEADAAREHAEKSGDPLLVEWVDRFRMKLMLRSGDLAGGEALASRLMERSESAPDIAYDLGLALYLRGSYDRAAIAFEDGLLNDRSPTTGRLKYEFIEGAMFSLLAAARTDAALEFVSRTPEMGESGFAAYRRDVYRAGILWLAGRDFDPPRIGSDDAGATDLWSYWAHEFAWRRTRDAGALLPRVRSDVAKGGTVVGLLRSLEAELLAALDRRDEAAVAARAAMEWTASEREHDILARAHEGVVKQRFESFATPGR